jgi:hypothetical protein
MNMLISLAVRLHDNLQYGATHRDSQPNRPLLAELGHLVRFCE